MPSIVAFWTLQQPNQTAGVVGLIPAHPGCPYHGCPYHFLPSILCSKSPFNVSCTQGRSNGCYPKSLHNVHCFHWTLLMNTVFLYCNASLRILKIIWFPLGLHRYSWSLSSRNGTLKTVTRLYGIQRIMHVQFHLITAPLALHLSPLYYPTSRFGFLMAATFLGILVEAWNMLRGIWTLDFRSQQRII